MPTIAPSFMGITDENELYVHWGDGDRWLSVYFKPPDDEDGPLDCFGGTGLGYDIDFQSVWEGYRWLVGAEEEGSTE
jgi:hypothetical protein